MMSGLLSLLLPMLLLSSFVCCQDDGDLLLDYDTAVTLAQLPLECYNQDYPHKYGLIFDSDDDLKSPRQIHPIFYGCFDWHSSVHGHWMLAALMNKFPGTELASLVAQLMDEQLTVEKVSVEMEVFDSESNSAFERTYGWAWLLKLHMELLDSPLDESRAWSRTLQPLTDKIAYLFKEYLPNLVYPVRAGDHPNTAFGLIFALDYATRVNDVELLSLIGSVSSSFYDDNQNCPLEWEPSGSDFLSQCLQEADLQGLLYSGDQDSFAAWCLDFLPQLFDGSYDLEPGQVADPSDGKLVHLEGLNFSRAWNLYHLVLQLPASFNSDKRRFFALADEHVRESKDEVVDGTYAATHWLATFMVHALIEREAAAEALQV